MLGFIIIILFKKITYFDKIRKLLHRYIVFFKDKSQRLLKVQWKDISLEEGQGKLQLKYFFAFVK